MKRVSVKMIVRLIALFTSAQVSAQPLSSERLKSAVITPFEMVVSYHKTTNLIFPFAIKSVDRGSPSVLAQKAKGTDNILQVKAGQQGFTQTNLSVVTADGKLYSFLIDYAAEPAVLNVMFLNEKNKIMTGERAGAILSGEAINEAELTNMEKEVHGQKDFLHTGSKEQKVNMDLKSIYLSGNAMWFTIEVANRSLIDYTPDYIRFFLRQRKRSKRTAMQETELHPLLNRVRETITGNSERKMSFAFRPFTIPRSKELVIQIGEQNGGRSLVLPISHRLILKARKLPGFPNTP